MERVNRKHDLEQGCFWREEIIASTAKMLSRKIVVHMEQADTVIFQPDESTEATDDNKKQLYIVYRLRDKKSRKDGLQNFWRKGASKICDEILGPYAKEGGGSYTTKSVEMNGNKLKAVRPCYMRRTTMERIITKSNKIKENWSKTDPKPMHNSKQQLIIQV